MTATMPDEVRHKARTAARNLADPVRQASGFYPAVDAAAEVAYAAGKRDAARRTGHVCEPCGRNDHDACTGDCQGSCCPAYAAGRADGLVEGERRERARVVALLRMPAPFPHGLHVSGLADRVERGEHLGE